jgi:hypothetical protein
MTFTALTEFAKPLGTTPTEGWWKMYVINGNGLFLNCCKIEYCTLPQPQYNDRACKIWPHIGIWR